MTSTVVDRPLVLTLDAGGTNFSFAAMRAGEYVGDPVVLPAQAHNLEKSLANLRTGFERVAAAAGEPADAISFAFPGPADYAAGVTYNQGNLPAYADGVPLAKIIGDHFGVPVLINNDGDLFALGEALFGRLPDINRRLEAAGSDRRFRNLIGLTLGTGFGGGVVIDGRLLRGDNGLAGEVWLLRHGDLPGVNAEEGVSVRAVVSAYEAATGHSVDQLTPRDIAEIARGDAPGDADAARAAFTRFGRALGDAVANLVTVLDGVVVLGGGLSDAHPLFMPGLLKAVGGKFSDQPNSPRRLVQCVYNLESEAEAEVFFAPDAEDESAALKPRQARSAIAVSRLGANRTVARGAYALAQQALQPR
ncbi:MAG: ROK family protein [Planctomycetota bacterium]